MYKRAAWCTLFVRHLRELEFDDGDEERLLHMAFHEWAVDHRRNPLDAANQAFSAAGQHPPPRIDTRNNV